MAVPHSGIMSGPHRRGTDVDCGSAAVTLLASAYQQCRPVPSGGGRARVLDPVGLSAVGRELYEVVVIVAREPVPLWRTSMRMWSPG